MIKLSNINKTFKDRQVINDISFEIKPGNIVALIGVNGAGKSTLVRLISTLYKQDTGKIIVDGIDSLKYPVAVRRKIGVLLGGDVALYNLLTARENILYFAELQGVSSKEANARLKELTEMFQMQDYIDRRVDKFSRGMKQKVAFARALIHSPKILLLDEPSTGLDIESIQTIRSFIRACKQEGKTILLSTHNVSEMELCDEYIFLKNGRISSRGKKDGIKNENDLKKLFE